MKGKTPSMGKSLLSDKDWSKKEVGFAFPSIVGVYSGLTTRSACQQLRRTKHYSALNLLNDC
jgi:hypothetical protein